MPAVTPKATEHGSDQVAESAARALTRKAITNSVQEVFIDVAARLTLDPDDVRRDHGPLGR